VKLPRKGLCLPGYEPWWNTGQKIIQPELIKLQPRLFLILFYVVSSFVWLEQLSMSSKIVPKKRNKPDNFEGFAPG